MKLMASLICLVVAFFLLLAAFSAWKEDADNASSNIQRGFSEMGDTVAFNADMQGLQSRRQSEQTEAIAGAAFLVTGLVLFRK